MSNQVVIPIHTVSNLETADQCLRKYYAIYVSKIPQTFGPETQEGNKVHKALENTLKRGYTLPAEYEGFRWALRPFEELRRQHWIVAAESPMAITRDWTPIDFWSKAPLPFFRGKTDAEASNGDLMIVTDWKTGKPKDDEFQNMTMAALKFALNPKIKRISTMFTWLRHNKISQPILYDRDRDFENMKQEINSRTTWIENEFARNEFPPEKGPLCGWCPVKQCEHWDSRDGKNT